MPNEGQPDRGKLYATEHAADHDRYAARMLAASPDAVVVATTSGAIVLVNQQAERLFARAHADLLGSRVERLIPERFHGAYRSRWERFSEDLYATEIRSTWELVALRGDGHELPIEVNLSPLRGPHGLLVSAVIRDLTERKRLEASWRHLAAIVEQTGDAIVAKDRNAIITEWNDGAERLYGYSAQEAIGQSISLIVPPDRHGEELVILGRTLGGARVEGFETVRRRKDGSLVDVWLTISPLADEAGEIAGVASIARDMSELKRASERFEGLLESAPDAMVIVGEAGNIELVNSQTEALFGYQRDELIGRPMEVLLPPALRQAHARHRRDYAAAPTPRVMGGDFDLRARRKDGSLFPVEISISPLRTREGVLVSAVVRDVTDSHEAKLALEHRAVHDPLTGLPNRTLLLDRLEQALARADRPRSRVAVLFFDVDNFKEVNDSLGHAAGDDLLVALTSRLLEAVRPADTLARFGGDEFVVLCEDLRDEAGAVSVAQRIAAAIEDPIVAAGRQHFISVSIGIVVVGRAGRSAGDVLRDADAAMYRAKSRGKGRYEVYDHSLRSRLLERLTLEREMRQGIAASELRLLYQPVVSLADGKVLGAEALVRWQHPTRGWLEPDSFIEAAERSGAIIALGKWVIEHALAQSAAWAEMFGGLPFTVSLNLSARQVAQPGLPIVVREALQAAGAQPGRVAVEITETALIEAPETAAESLAAVKELGVIVVLDDFGTGYSSLSYLKRFPIDGIKIDRSFVSGLDQQTGDEAIIAAVISMANALGKGVIAEGVETATQAELLLAHGCRWGQGYHYAPPLPPDEITEMIAALAAASGAGSPRRTR